jgi:CspA family cold shock protein
VNARGRVRLWNAEEGWGVIGSEATPGGCWTHFSHLLMPGFKVLSPGDDVELVFEHAGQDGYDYRAVDVWPASTERVDNRTVTAEPTEAYRSAPTITFDAEDD